MPAELIIYAVIAAGLVFWLRGVLGTRTEGDDKITTPSKLDALPDEPAGELKLADAMDIITPQDQINAAIEDKTGVLGIENKDAERGLLTIMEADKSFDLKFFLNAAQDVFVYVVESFADGDRDTLRDLLKPDVYKVFDQAITDRETREESATTEIHAIHKAHVVEARLDKKTALITVRFTADETSVLRDKEGEIIDGHPERTKRMTDIWTFARPLKSRDPRWLVVETRGDFDGDNDFIPNAE